MNHNKHHYVFVNVKHLASIVSAPCMVTGFGGVSLPLPHQQEDDGLAQGEEEQCHGLAS